jgi:hypothetical protein
MMLFDLDEDERRLLASYRRADSAGQRVIQGEMLRLANGLPPRSIAACLAEAEAYRREAASAGPQQSGIVVQFRKCERNPQR